MVTLVSLVASLIVDRGSNTICCLSFLQPVRVPIDCTSGYDIVALDLHGPVSCRLICCYRPPSASGMQTVLFCADLMKLCDCQLPLVFVGDYNLPQINWDSMTAPSSPHYIGFLDLINYVGLSQLVFQATRLDNILDLVLTTDSLFVSAVAVIEGFGTSDHSAVTFSMLGSYSDHPSMSERQRNFRKMNTCLAKQHLSDTSAQHCIPFLIE